MKRWCITKFGDYENDGARVPAVNKYLPNGQLRQDLLNDPCVPSDIKSKPNFNWGIGKVSASDLTLMQADPDIYILPDGTMDMSVGSIPVAVRNTMRTKLENAGFVFTDVKTSWTIRQMLLYLQKQIQPLLNSVEQGDIRDVTN